MALRLVIGAGSSGSLISKITVPPPSSLNYEVSTTLTLQASGCTYVQYLRASTNALSNGSASGLGTYLAVELQNPSFSATGACSAYLFVYQDTGSGPAALLSTPVACTNGMQLRTVVFGSSANIVLNGVVYTLSNNIASCSGTCAPGVGGRGMPSGNSISQVELDQWDNVAPGQINFDTFTSTVDFTGASGQPG